MSCKSTDLIDGDSKPIGPDLVIVGMKITIALHCGANVMPEAMAMVMEAIFGFGE